MPFFEAQGICKRFGGLQAVRDMSVALERREILGLIGPNGAGKTTFFNIIAGVYRPDSGTLTYRGQDITAATPHAVNRLGIARTFQIPRPFQSMTVLENIMVGLIPRARGSAAEDEAAELARVVGLESRLLAPGSGLSTGQRKRLEVARALSTRPELVLLDEMTGGVDQRTVPALIDLAFRIRERGTTLIVIEHNMAVMQQIADRIVFMELGAKTAEGTPAEIAKDPNVIRVYLGEQFL